MSHRRTIVLAIITGLGAGVLYAARGQLASTRPCATENAQISINFNGMDSAVMTVKFKLDAKISEVTALAKEEGFTKFDMQSYSYNISGVSNGGYGSDAGFQYNGSASFVALPGDKAVSLMALLVRKGYQASVNVSSYANGNCVPALLR